MTESKSPPRATIAIRVGVVGHRPNRLVNADGPNLRRVIRELLNRIRQTVLEFAVTSPSAALYAADAPILRCISPLAEGTDRIFAEEALALQFEVCCPMPFPQAEFELDFLPPRALEHESVNQFRNLLDRAKRETKLVTFELDGTHARADDAYAAAGRVVLNQSDLLVVVWDGHEGGRGGTLQTLEEAIRYQVPVVWIDAVAPHDWRILRSEPDLSCLRHRERCTPGANLDDWQTLSNIVIDELATPPEAGVGAREHSKPPLYHDYFTQRKARRHPRFVWKLFRDLLGEGTFTWQSSKVVDYVEQLQASWRISSDRSPASSPRAGQPPDDTTARQTVSDWVNAKLRSHYAWSDKPADLYGDKYRSTYVAAYLMAAIAVVLALLPAAAGWSKDQHTLQTVCIASELLILGGIIGLVARGRSRQWHDHWIEYRILAELIRQLRVLIPLGGGRPFPHVPFPAHLADYGDLTQTWMYWHMRAIARATGIPNATVTRDYLRQCIEYLVEVVGRVVPHATSGPATPERPTVAGGQYAFHDRNARRSATIEHRLHRTALTFLGLTVVAVATHLVRHIFGAHPADANATPRIDGWLMLASAALPALGAALAGIENQGEFARVAKRSRAMAENFESFAVRLHDMLHRTSPAAETPTTLMDVTPIAEKIAQLMVDEVADWRVVFKDRPQREPA